MILGIAVILTGIAAFLAGRLFGRGASPLGLFAGNGISMVTDILPAGELPDRPPEAEGLFVERYVDVILVQTNQPNPDKRGVEVGSPSDIGNGPKVEVVISAETLIYHDVTQAPTQRPTREHNPPIQQTVEEGTLDDLNAAHSLVMVWGRRSGDRMIAEILLYSNPVSLKGP